MQGVQLIQGDCLSVMPTLPDASVDLILADLPYGTTQCAWDSVIPLEPLWEQYLRIAKPNAAIVLCAAQPFTSTLVASQPSLFRYEWIWEKGHATGHLNAKKQPLRAHESAVVFYRKQPTYNPQMTSGHDRKTATKRRDRTQVYGAQTFDAIAYDSTERYPRSVQFFSSDKQRSAFHPTQKPVAWMEFLVRTYTNPGMVVLDNTCGSGSSGVAAVRSGCSYIGIEKDRGENGESLGYLDTARRRIDEELMRLNDHVCVARR
ncbi:TPA: site-specific DNA-methyltransferase [Pseudomonas aeruginosa]|uniref:DNA-methyltransferase n=2 Tax=Pseudomonas aeruginosa TaxID=287 RepID=UPI000F8679B3|nr:DNA methyltransferase [Pseudomonas aeruginosa]MCT5234072.1 site-specific DNA-methyltransferase [Pseudomonas aeruginosa]MDI4100813.1 DNA methyltransferase [Pseudomonas aeruginosa]QPZ57170.1 site-specific DNA-methyltransferase [Pseudomonas aeruginosa]RUJ61443.1 site-specific DNA-methyltransferase [Pseudomonas aeruginosa]HBO0952582.1 site-specific DNA-methyltransferase [Pseudomonas aeruginosa]